MDSFPDRSMQIVGLMFDHYMEMIKAIRTISSNIHCELAFTLDNIVSLKTFCEYTLGFFLVAVAFACFIYSRNLDTTSTFTSTPTSTSSFTEHKSKIVVLEEKKKTNNISPPSPSLKRKKFEVLTPIDNEAAQEIQKSKQKGIEAFHQCMSFLVNRNL
jgi:hypothetical protein